MVRISCLYIGPAASVLAFSPCLLPPPVVPLPLSVLFILIHNAWNNEKPLSQLGFFISYFPKRAFFLPLWHWGYRLGALECVIGIVGSASGHRVFSVKEWGAGERDTFSAWALPLPPYSIQHTRRSPGSDPSAELNPSLCYTCCIFQLRLQRSLAEN